MARVISSADEATPTEQNQQVHSTSPASCQGFSSSTTARRPSVVQQHRQPLRSTSMSSRSSLTLTQRLRLQMQRLGGRGVMVCLLSALTASIFALDLMAFGRSQESIRLGFAGELMDTVVQSFNEGDLSTELTVLVCLIAMALGVTRAKPQQPATRQVRQKGAPKVPPVNWSEPAGAQPANNNNPSKRSTAVTKLNQSIDVVARAGNVAKALELIHEHERAGGTLDVVTYNLGLRACAKGGKLKQAEQLVEHMISRGVTPTLCSFNTLLDVCAKADEPEACEAWLLKMQQRGLEPNVISYATTIYARARRGDVSAAEAWLQRMIEVGIRPDAVSYNSVIHACGVQGNIEKAERWLREMQSQDLETSVATYTAVVDACAKRGDVARAEQWMECMVQSGVQPNVVTFSAMIDACARTRNLRRALHWHDRMKEYGVLPNAYTFSAVINACAKMASADGAEEAERWLELSEQAGFSNDVVVYSAVIDACGKANDAERAMRIFNRMRAKGLTPHIVAYAALARPFAYRGDWIKVESIAQTMASDGITTNEYFLYAQLLAYGVARPRQPERAEARFRAALKSGIKANDHVVSALARAVGRGRCAELMRELCGGREVPAQHLRGRNGGGGGARGA